MCEWASVNSAAVRQRRVLQETTMARTSTLLEACYYEDLRYSATKGFNGTTDSEQKSMKPDADNTDEVLEHDMDVGEQEIIQNELGNETTFLLGANSRLGRSIKCNRKFLLKVFEGKQDG